MSDALRIGISTCPNDTFAFHALLAGEVDLDGLPFAIELGDIEELNGRMRDGALDVAKVSFHAALHLADRVRVLGAGSALGYGVGPLLVAAAGRAEVADPLVLCPGEGTTATLLHRLFHPEHGRVEHVVFSDIFPRLRAGRADRGVCIHEGRFTWREQGLELVEDLGETWERAAESPLPLGGLVASRALPLETCARVRDGVARSITWGLEHRERCLPTMRRYAQELSDEVLESHVDLYVNERTLELGDPGRQALERLAELAEARELIPRGRRLEVV